MVLVRIYDLHGKQIAEPVKQYLKNGTYEIEWNAGNYSSGIYFCYLYCGNFEQSNKMVLIK